MTWTLESKYESSFLCLGNIMTFFHFLFFLETPQDLDSGLDMKGKLLVNWGRGIFLSLELY